jgi:hypothetical protein
MLEIRLKIFTSIMILGFYHYNNMRIMNAMKESNKQFEELQTRRTPPRR